MVLPDDDVNRLRIALARISRTVDRQVAGDGMTRTQLSVLGTVARHKTIGLRELADVEGLNPTMLSRIVGRLQSDGLLERTPGEHDRRAAVVEITPTGARLHSRLRGQRVRLFAERLEELGAQQAGALRAAIPALESLADAMRPTEPARVRVRETAAAR